MNFDKATEYDYSDTSTAREVIYALNEELKRVNKLNAELIECIDKLIHLKENIKSSTDEQ